MAQMAEQCSEMGADEQDIEPDDCRGGGMRVRMSEDEYNNTAGQIEDMWGTYI